MTSSPAPDLPAFRDVEDAVRRIEGHAVLTPLLESPLLNEQLGCRLLIKAEMLQRTGSFKFRGAYNRVSRTASQGVVACSSGNHGQGVAAAARIMGLSALIVMPADAPGVKIAGTRAQGAEIVFYDRDGENREQIAQAIADERGSDLIRPYDDPHIIAGQGTAGLELAAQARVVRASLDAVLVPCGGGGLVSGCALALAETSPATEVYAVEPEGFDDTARSLEAGRRLANEAGARSFCDALLAPMPGEVTYAINARLLAGGLVVGDGDVARAMAALFTSFKLVAEPGGAVALAACLSGAFDCKGKTVAVVTSGGNVDAGTFRDAMEDPSTAGKA
jgi:threonine dehydratase